MNNLGMKLLNQTVKFLEICQNGVMNGRINFDDYYCLARFKMDFIDSILADSPKKVIADKEMRVRLGKIYYNNNILCQMYRK